MRSSAAPIVARMQGVRSILAVWTLCIGFGVLVTLPAQAETSERPVLSHPEVEDGARAQVRVYTNIRKGPGTGFGVIDVAAPGEVFEITGRNEAATWWRIDFHGQDGWLYAPLVDSIAVENVPVVAQPPTSATPTARPTGAQEPQVRILRSMNIRGGPGTRFPIVGIGRPGQTFPLTGVNDAGNWWRITHQDVDAWVYAPLVQAQGTENVAVVPEPTPTGTPEPDRSVSDGTDTPPTLSSATPIPADTVTVYESSVTIPTYPYEKYQNEATNEVYGWRFKRFDRDRYDREAPLPENRVYRLLVLENAYLKVTILPELGGRIWQAIHKPTGANLFYQNPVVKPSPWGPPEQLGWLALGGMEWALPVVEHGYAWGEPWTATSARPNPQQASVTVTMPQNGRALAAAVTITLRAGSAAFEVRPTIRNMSGGPVSFAFWSTAMLAPGRGNKPGGSTQFIMPGPRMTVHSTGDPRLPQPGAGFDWPRHAGVDYRRLGNWNRWLGFFERPAAHGPFVGLYDPEEKAGVVRIYPAAVVRGSKAFGMGWSNPIGSDNFTDDGSAYVELHGGLAPTFDDQYRLAPAASISWSETWYPVAGLDGVRFANERASLFVGPGDTGLTVGVYPTAPWRGRLRVNGADGSRLAEMPFSGSPDSPFQGTVDLPQNLPNGRPVQVLLLDGNGRIQLEYTYHGRIR